MSSEKNYSWKSVFMPYFVFVKGREHDPDAYVYYSIRRFVHPLSEEERRKFNEQLHIAFVRHIQSKVLLIKDFDHVVIEGGVMDSVPDELNEIYEADYRNKLSDHKEEQKLIAKRPRLTLVTEEPPTPPPKAPDAPNDKK